MLRLRSSVRVGFSLHGLEVSLDAGTARGEQLQVTFGFVGVYSSGKLPWVLSADLQTEKEKDSDPDAELDTDSSPARAGDESSKSWLSFVRPLIDHRVPSDAFATYWREGVTSQHDLRVCSDAQRCLLPVESLWAIA